MAPIGIDSAVRRWRVLAIVFEIIALMVFIIALMVLGLGVGNLIDERWVFPLCLTFHVFAIVSLSIMMFSSHRVRAKIRNVEQINCIGCGYDLCGLGKEPNCPECGRLHMPEELKELRIKYYVIGPYDEEKPKPLDSDSGM